MPGRSTHLQVILHQSTQTQQTFGYRHTTKTSGHGRWLSSRNNFVNLGSFAKVFVSVGSIIPCFACSQFSGLSTQTATWPYTHLSKNWQLLKCTDAYLLFIDLEIAKKPWLLKNGSKFLASQIPPFTLFPSLLCHGLHAQHPHYI